MNSTRYPAAAVLLLLAACGSESSESGTGGDEPIGPPTTMVTTGLEGHVVRGPVQPVCMTDQPCEEPFAATFHVNREGAEVAEFSSGADGYFVVYLEPGNYEIVPGAASPLLDPEQQAQPVRVAETGLMRIELSFDTGIR